MSEHKALLRAGWSPSSINTITLDLTSPELSSLSLTSSTTTHNKENITQNNEIINKEKNLLEEAGWSPGALLSALDSPSPSPQTPNFVLDLTSDTPSPPIKNHSTLYVTKESSKDKNESICSLSERFSRSKITESTPTDQAIMISTVSTFNPSVSQLSHTKNSSSARDKKINTTSTQEECKSAPSTHQPLVMKPLENISLYNSKSKKKDKPSKNEAEADSPEVLNQPLPNGWTLFDYQKDSIMQCLHHERVILALDMGLGKTIISVMWAKVMCERYPPGTCVALVVSPCTLLENWKRESEMMGFTCVSNADTCGTDFEVDGRVINTTNPQKLLLQTSWAKIPSPQDISDAVVRYNKMMNIRTGATKFVIMCDEAHAMQSLTSQRTQVCWDE